MERKTTFGRPRAETFCSVAQVAALLSLPEAFPATGNGADEGPW